MTQRLDALVRDRAGGRCEYCQLHGDYSDLPFEVDHIVAKKHRGETVAENLALACFYCNSYKGPNVAGIDPDTGRHERLFNPRRDQWDDHFYWSGPRLIGTTPIGRTTVDVLRINHPDAVNVRTSLIDEGVFP